LRKRSPSKRPQPRSAGEKPPRQILNAPKKFGPPQLFPIMGRAVEGNRRLGAGLERKACRDSAFLPAR
jgi:hypothetical protein